MIKRFFLKSLMVEDFVLKMKTLGYFQASSVAAL